MTLAFYSPTSIALPLITWCGKRCKGRMSVGISSNSSQSSRRTITTGASETRRSVNSIRDHVLRLTYTAHDMVPFARDLGYNGPPFIWDEEERRHLRARLDALYFLLYGLSREDADYILSTFPIVRREDEAAFGTYRTRDSGVGLYECSERRGYGDSRQSLTCRLTNLPPIDPPPPPSFQPPRAEIHPISLLPSTELEAHVRAEHARGPLFLSPPSPLKALRVEDAPLA